MPCDEIGNDDFIARALGVGACAWIFGINKDKDTGKLFFDYSNYIIEKYKDHDWNEQDRLRQLHKRSRYVEFNLLYDRGTKFGLETGGNVEAILMSMPPIASWD